ncbi:hypothetical protein SAMN05421636_10840 [Pricia antarctica]|uniref:Uncharacterized protein n=1 Tax=Pricia antarctica TaxID=641691 RepID=A0A1G7GA53_9FLAO|nr:hypothetical protein [Pricia antarctica]SDE85000.1 hypothetical protein SAMN05421636_10840 [Pricia antarctica]
MKEKSIVNTETTENPEKNTKDGFGLITYVIAIGVLIAYGFFIHFLTGRAGAEEPEWSRLIYLFSGVEAIVFAAAGFLFGREVNRKRAKNAEEEKKQADKEKEVAKKQMFDEKKKGLMLGAMAIQEEKTMAAMTPENMVLEGMAPKPAIASIAKAARNMYPELEDL